MEEEKEAANKILQVQIMPGDSEDRLYWKHSRIGDCNTKSAYKEFMKRENPITHQIWGNVDLVPTFLHVAVLSIRINHPDTGLSAHLQEVWNTQTAIQFRLRSRNLGKKNVELHSPTAPPLNARNRRRTRKTSPPNRPAKLRRRTLRNRRRACKISPEAARFSIKNWKSLLYHGETRSRTLTGGDRQADEEY
uniref:Uncharacterized protein n=1 Tax=Oryza nivara TaxID=4536 RepID=A0A0E0FZ71_ORYNI